MEPPAPSPKAAGGAASLDYLLWILHWTGTLRHPRARSWSARLFYLRFAFSVMLFVYFCTSHVILMFRRSVGNIDHFTLALSILDTGVVWIVRLLHFLKHEQDFHRLALQERDDFREFTTERDVPELRSRSRAMRRFVLSYLSLGLCDVTMWLTSPMRDQGLPLEVILPFSTSHPVGWAVGWLICAYATVDSVVVNMMADAFNVSLMMQLRTQLIVLTRNITDLVNDGGGSNLTPPQTPFEGPETKQKDYALKTPDSHHQKTNSLLVDVDVKGAQQPYQILDKSSVQYRLRKIVLHHQAIIRNVDFLQQCMGGMLLAQSLGLGAAICMLLFQVALTAQGARETGKICGYLCAMFTELSVFCWFGDKLMSESEEVAFAAYDAVTSLQECPMSVKRSLLLMMHRAQRPLCITAAGFYPFCRESFVAIINVSYSFFAILRNFKEE